MSALHDTPSSHLDLSGLTVPMVTPCVGGQVDERGITNLIDFLADSHVDAIFALGTTGEFQRLSLEQKKVVIARVICENRDRMKILIGISSPTLSETQEVLVQAMGHGADGVVLAPLFGEGDPEKKIDEVADSSRLPVTLYTNSGITQGKSLDADVVTRAKAHPNVVGIKDSSGNADYFARLLALQDEGFSVLQGEERRALESLISGARGLVAGTANVFPGVFKSLIERRNPADAVAIQRVQAEIKAVLGGNYIQKLKWKLARSGVIRSDEMF